MSSKRHTRRKQCEGKRRYADAAAAAKFAFGKLHVYHCQFCGGYRVGHPRLRLRELLRFNKRD